ncbi:hypothetical protein GCM10010394_54490 [Streptomyces crystallinus]|uniref:Uncharacterized protein n=1 Tax=Streptomyces crystallinus TaxID=68191 RepID=A0ABN1GRK3_9ACTN
MRLGVTADAAEVECWVVDGDSHDERAAPVPDGLAHELVDAGGVEVGIEDGAAVAHEPIEVERARGPGGRRPASR